VADIRELRIDRLGAQGDGIAGVGASSIFVPYALPGESIEAEVEGERGRLLRVIAPSKDRVPPVCRHFGTCGGCSVQDLASEAYAAWKRELVVQAFSARGLTPDVEPLQRPHGKRRRAVLTAVWTNAGLEIGFHEAASHALVALTECPVLEPKIVAAIPAIGNLIAPLLSKRGEARLTITLTRAGLDVEVEGTERKLTPDVRVALASSASVLGLARVVVGGDVIVETLQPFLRFGPAEVVLPPGVFVQAVEAAESEIARRIVASLGKGKKVADLFSGMGAFTFPVAEKARVAAFDGSRAAITALGEAARKTAGLKPVLATVRDLFRDPLSPLELNEFDVVVFDPPRAGAEAQSERLARSKVKTVIAVSCNPATLARDARHLVDGGFKIGTVTPVDQFAYSAHVEAVAVFRR
jgi:23S rRNA (uracil1939-C5)-methyltransferase